MVEKILHELFIICLLSTFVIFVCHKIKIPPIVGFLITGALCGPSTFGLVSDLDAVNTLSEIGIVFLLFTIGLEISIGELIRLRKSVFFGGLVQVMITIIIFWFLAERVWHDTTGADIFIGFLIALSSTAIVLQALQQNGMIESPAGRISLSILIFQDLMIVPMMLSIPLLAGKNDPDINMAELAIAAGKALGIALVVFVLARKFIPWALYQIIKTKSRELFLLCIIGICIGTAYGTAELGLSLSLGAFMAGLIVAESEYSHSALEGILPFKDVFTSMFFISVGMLLDVGYFLPNITDILLITLLILFLKTAIVTAVAKILRYPMRTALITGLTLCQVGEFSFVLAKTGLGYSLLSEEHYQLFLASSILTMAATPFLVKGAPAISRKICSLFAKTKSMPSKDESEEKNSRLSDHLIILGFGVSGKLLARAARMASIPYIILEMNPDTVKTYSAKGEPIYYGDAIHPAVLKQLGASNARVLAIVMSDPAAIRIVIENAMQINPHLHILARTRFLGEVTELQELGAQEVVSEEFETCIELFTRVLGKYLVPHNKIEKFTHDIRAENYSMLRRVEQLGAPISSLQQYVPDMILSVFTLEKDSMLDGVTLESVNLRQHANITVVAVNRDGQTFTHPGGSFKLLDGDLVYVFSSPEDANGAAKLFMGTGHDENDDEEIRPLLLE